MPAKKTTKKSVRKTSPSAGYTQSFKPVSRKDVKLHPHDKAAQEVFAAGFAIAAIIFFTYMYKMYG